MDWLQSAGPDVLAVQEIKARPDQLQDELLAPAGYHVTWNPADRPGYSGVATFSKKKPRTTMLGFGSEEYGGEGRVLVTQHQFGVPLQRLLPPTASPATSG